MFKLTNRELEVLKLIVKGFSSKQIAEQLNRSSYTIEEKRKIMLERFRMFEGEEQNMFSLIHFVTKQGYLE